MDETARRPQPAQTDPEASLIKWTYGLVNRIAMAIDAVCLLAGTALFWNAANPATRPLNWLQAGSIAATMAIVFHSVVRSTRGYRVERYQKFRRSIADTLGGLIIASLPALLVVWAFLPDPRGAMGWMAWWIWVSFLSLVLGRQTVRAILIVVRRMGLLRRRVAVVGTGPLADGIVHRMTTEMSHDDFELIGTIDPAANTFRHHVSGATATSEDFVLYVQEHGLDLLVVALPWSRSQEIYALVHRLQWIAADVVVPFDAGGLRPSFAPPLAFVDGPVLQLMHRPFKGSQGLIKAVEDYVVASIELLLVSPIMALAALAIKLEGKGPIIFKQPRVGFNSKPFMIYKFRSMTVDPTDDGSRQATKGDQRVTRVGAFLRKTSIDELPQLINVLRGEMSIVGPRPHVSNMQVGGTGVYSEIVQQYAARHRIKPGITGWAQINGMRGGIETLEKATRGAELDLHYVANWSPKLDLEIMIRTVVAGLVGRNVF